MVALLQPFYFPLSLLSEPICFLSCFLARGTESCVGIAHTVALVPTLLPGTGAFSPHPDDGPRCRVAAQPGSSRCCFIAWCHSEPTPSATLAGTNHASLLRALSLFLSHPPLSLSHQPWWNASATLIWVEGVCRVWHLNYTMISCE
jgi:hypothetical protein